MGTRGSDIRGKHPPEAEERIRRRVEEIDPEEMKRREAVLDELAELAQKHRMGYTKNGAGTAGEH